VYDNIPFENLEEWEKRTYMDWGEVTCWACGLYFGDAAQHDSSCLDTYRGWEKRKGLERCHIVPASLNGSNEPSNLVLMCHICHLESPDVKEPKYLFQWMNARPGIAKAERIERIRSACAHLDIAFEDAACMIMESNYLHEKEFNKYQEDHSGAHFGVFKWATELANLKSFLEMKFDGKWNVIDSKERLKTFFDQEAEEQIPRLFQQSSNQRNPD